jgi:hypothetical protein
MIKTNNKALLFRALMHSSLPSRRATAQGPYPRRCIRRQLREPDGLQTSLAPEDKAGGPGMPIARV